MEQYPHTHYWQKTIPFGTEIWAFEKIDGSNFRVEWQRKLSKKSTQTCGFAKFGTRTQMIKKVTENFGDGVDFFDEVLAEDLDNMFTNEQFFKKYNKITVFCEYWGKNSEFGRHDPADEKTLFLIDLHLQNRGMIHPRDFVNYIGKFPACVAKLIYHGEFTKEFVEDVYDGKYDLDEGVMIKTVVPTKNAERTVMAKLKTKRWFDRLKEKYGQKAVDDELKN